MSSSSCLSLYFFIQSYFHLFLIPAVPDEISMEDPLCDSSFGSVVTLDYVTPDTLNTKFPKLIKKETTITRGDPLCSDNSEIP